MNCEELKILKNMVKKDSIIIAPENTKIFWYGDFKILTEIIKIVENEKDIEKKKQFIEYYLKIREFCKNGVNEIWEEEK